MNSRVPLAVIGFLTAAIVVVLLLPTGPSGDGFQTELSMPHTWFSENEDESTWPSMPWLHAEENRIVDEYGNMVVLRGVNVEDPWRFYNSEQALKLEVFRTLSEVWHVNVIRLPLYPMYWEMYSENLLSEFYDPVIMACHKYGMYVILEWHGVGNPLTGQTADLFWGQDARLELAENAWPVLAERYKDNSWVLYDVFNEPLWISWDNWKPVAENLIDIIRSHNPRALIVVPGVNCSADLRAVATDPVSRDNIIYAAHIYPDTAGIVFRSENKEVMWRRLETYVGFVAENYPLIVSEWGYDSTGEYPNFPSLQASRGNYADHLLEWLHEKKLSWAGWVWSASWAVPMIEDWNTYAPTEFGQLVKDALGAPIDSSDNDGAIIIYAAGSIAVIASVIAFLYRRSKKPGDMVGRKSSNPAALLRVLRVDVL